MIKQYASQYVQCIDIFMNMPLVSEWRLPWL